MRKTLEQKFWYRVDRRSDEECWPWTGGLLEGGYGQMTDENWRPVSAHRASWRINRWPIPSGLQILHKCDNRRCVNPGHLFLGTQKDNMQDMIQKGRKYLGRHSHSDIRAIRERYARGGISQATLGRLFGCSESFIWRIVHRKERNDVPDIAPRLNCLN